MVENRKLLIALVPVVLIGLVARFGLVRVRSMEGVYYERLPNETANYKAVTVYVCPKCRQAVMDAFLEFRAGRSSVGRPEDCQLFYREPTESGFCKYHPDTRLEATVDVPIGPETKFGLPEDTKFITHYYVAKDSPPEAALRPIDVTVVISAKDRRSIHRAESCLQAQRWTPLRAPRFEMLRGKGLPGGTFAVRSLLMFRDVPTESGQQFRWELPVYYWYAALPDRRTSSEYKRLILTFYDRLIRGLNFRWSYVLVSRPVPMGQSSSATAKEIERFIMEFVEEIEKDRAAGGVSAETGGGRGGSASGAP
jgi:hypothetical protein